MIDFRNAPPGYPQGIYDMDFEQYIKIPALNSSKLKHLRKTPAHFKAALEAPPEDLTTAQRRMFAIGKAFDIYVLEGRQTLIGKVAIEPALRRNTKKYKNWRTLADAAGRIVLSANDYYGVLTMAKCAYKKTKFSDLFSAGYPHRVIIWQDTKTGLWCKAEIDWITPDSVVVDLKSSADADWWFFQRLANRLGYVNQAAHYLSGLTAVTGKEHLESRLAVVEKDPPYESHVFKPSIDQILRAKQENDDRMDRLKHCLDSDLWPGYLDLVVDLDSGQYYDDFTPEEMEVDFNF